MAIRSRGFTDPEFFVFFVAVGILGILGSLPLRILGILDFAWEFLVFLVFAPPYSWIAGSGILGILGCDPGTWADGADQGMNLRCLSLSLWGLSLPPLASTTPIPAALKTRRTPCFASCDSRKRCTDTNRGHPWPCRLGPIGLFIVVGSWILECCQ